MPAASETPTSAIRPWALSGLPPLPTVALKVLEILSREDVEVREVSEWIQGDPAFAAELLRVANSPLFGFLQPILSVQHATVSLGMDFVKALATTVALRAYLKSALRIPTLRRCWRHSLACAFLTEELAVACSGKRDVAYTAGLLHDIGRMSLLAAYPAEYANMLGVSAEYSFDLLDCERDLFDIDHCAAGAWLAEQWKLPAEIGEIAAHHHEDVPEGEGLLTLVALGCRFADALDFSVLPTHHKPSVEEIRRQLPERVQLRYQPDLAALRAKINTRVESMS